MSSHRTDSIVILSIRKQRARAQVEENVSRQVCHHQIVCESTVHLAIVADGSEKSRGTLGQQATQYLNLLWTVLIDNIVCFLLWAEKAGVIATGPVLHLHPEHDIGAWRLMKRSVYSHFGFNFAVLTVAAVICAVEYDSTHIYILRLNTIEWQLNFGEKIETTCATSELSGCNSRVDLMAHRCQRLGCKDWVWWHFCGLNGQP